MHFLCYCFFYLYLYFCFFYIFFLFSCSVTAFFTSRSTSTSSPFICQCLFHLFINFCVFIYSSAFMLCYWFRALLLFTCSASFLLTYSSSTTAFSTTTSVSASLNSFSAIFLCCWLNDPFGSCIRALFLHPYLWLFHIRYIWKPGFLGSCPPFGVMSQYSNHLFNWSFASMNPIDVLTGFRRQSTTLKQFCIHFNHDFN